MSWIQNVIPNGVKIDQAKLALLETQMMSYAQSQGYQIDADSKTVYGTKDASKVDEAGKTTCWSPLIPIRNSDGSETGEHYIPTIIGAFPEWADQGIGEALYAALDLHEEEIKTYVEVLDEGA